MIRNLTLSEAREFARHFDGTYRKVSDYRWDDDKHEFVNEASWMFMDWSEFYVWKKQK